MAFGIKRDELIAWKRSVKQGNISFLTHYWQHPKYPGIKTVTKVGCSNIERLIQWGQKYGLKKEWIHIRAEFPHFDLIGDRQKEILKKEEHGDHLLRFRMGD